MLSFTKDEKYVCLQLLRAAIYVFLMAGLIFLFRFFAFRFKAFAFQEYGIIETIQLLLLAVSATVFMFEAFFFRIQRSLLFLFASLCMFAFCRELDSYFDTIIPYVSWKFAFLFPFAALVSLYRNREQARAPLFQFLKSPAFWLMFMGVCIGIILAQCFGHRPMVAAVLGAGSDARLARRIFEEGTESIGYFWILLSSVEFYFNFKRSK